MSKEIITKLIKVNITDIPEINTTTKSIDYDSKSIMKSPYKENWIEKISKSEKETAE